MSTKRNTLERSGKFEVYMELQKSYPMAKVLVSVGKYEPELEVAVVEGCEKGVLLGLDIGIFLLLHGAHHGAEENTTLICEVDKEKTEEKVDEQDDGKQQQH